MATILLLALTVTLFASIFAWVTAFPPPPTQNNNQFQASLAFPSNGTLTWISGIRIVHLAGPSVLGTSLVYLKSANQPTAPEFQSPYTVSSGLSGALTWNLGQTWALTFPITQMPLSSSNITIYIVASSGSLLFSVILPGTTLHAAPTVVATSVYPANPAVHQSFTVNATLAGTYQSNSVYVNLAAVPGGPGTAKLMTLNANGQWTYTWSAGASSNGTFYGFVNATGTNGQTGIGTVVITVTGGTSNGPLSVGVVLVPSPPNSATPESVQAVVTYTGPALSSPAAVSVSFAATSTPSGYTFSGTGTTGVTISGPSGPASVTVASQSSWTIPNPNTLTLYTFNVSATATVTGVGTITGSTSFTPATVIVGTSSGIIGTTVTVRGAGFVPSTKVNLTLGSAIVTPSGTTNSTCTFSGYTITTTSTGTFVCRFAVPNAAPSTATALLATDVATGQNDSAPFAVTPWTLSVAVSPALIGNIVTARGAGFEVSTGLTMTFDGITITPYGTTNSTCTFSGSTITATSAGAFVCRFVVPNGSAPGAATILASDPTSTQVASASGFSVTAWGITLYVVSIPHGTSTTVERITGFGFDSASIVSLSLGGTIITPSACVPAASLSGQTITTNATGTFFCTYTVPSVASSGIYTFVATDATSGQVATAILTRT